MGSTMPNHLMSNKTLTLNQTDWEMYAELARTYLYIPHKLKHTQALQTLRWRLFYSLCQCQALDTQQRLHVLVATTM